MICKSCDPNVAGLVLGLSKPNFASGYSLDLWKALNGIYKIYIDLHPLHLSNRKMLAMCFFFFVAMFANISKKRRKLLLFYTIAICADLRRFAPIFSDFHRCGRKCRITPRISESLPISPRNSMSEFSENENTNK